MKKEKKQVFIQKNIFYTIGSWFVFYCIALPLLFLVNKIVLGFKIKNKKHLKSIKKTGGVTISNHVFLLDCEMVAFATAMKKPWFVLHYWSLNIPVAGALARILGGVPTPSKLREVPRFFDELAAEIKKKKIVHIYPEGHLVSRDVTLRPFEKGAFRLSLMAMKPVAPMLFSYYKRNWFIRIFLKKPGFLLHCFPQIEPIEGELPEDFRDRVFEIMQGHQKEIQEK